MDGGDSPSIFPKLSPNFPNGIPKEQSLPAPSFEALKSSKPPRRRYHRCVWRWWHPHTCHLSHPKKNKNDIPLKYWLVVEPTHLKNMSQNGNLPQLGVKINNIWNHQLEYCLFKRDPYFMVYCNLHVWMGLPNIFFHPKNATWEGKVTPKSPSFYVVFGHGIHK